MATRAPTPAPETTLPPVAETPEPTDPSIEVSLDGASTDGTSAQAGEELVAADVGEEPAAPEGELVEGEPEEDFRPLLGQIVQEFGDEILETDQLKDRINKLVRSEVEKQRLELQRARDAEVQVERMLQQARTSADRLAGMAQVAKAEIEKAARGEEVRADVFDPTWFAQELGQYGQAMQTEVKNYYDRSITSAFEDIPTSVMPVPSEEDMATLTNQIEVAHRMARDPNQYARAQRHFFSSLFNFIGEQARKAGAAEERERLGRQRTLQSKITNTNALKAAVARQARAKAPPEAPLGMPQTSAPVTIADMEARYEQLKKEGKTSEAQDMVNRMAAIAALRQ